jgi:hypothetical protein
MAEEGKNDGESGTHQDNDLSRVQKIMKDNDLPIYRSTPDKEDDNTSTD